MSELGRLFRTTEEQLEPLTAYVTGTIPDWLSGSYLRAGPGVFDVKDFTVNHWCDGFGVVYKFAIHNGEVKFSKRIVQSDAYKKVLSVGKPVFTEFGTKAYSDTNKNIFQKLVSNVVPEITDNVAANIFNLGNSIYLSTESCNMRILQPENLTTAKKVDASQYITLNRLCSHVYTDQDESATTYTIGSAFTNNFKCQIIKIIPNQSDTKEITKIQNLCTIPNRTSKYSSYSHSFGFTENYIVYIEQPMFMNNMKLMTAHVKGKSLVECMEWNPQEPTRFILIEKKSGEQSRIIYESDIPFFFLHVINCYEKDKEVIVDVIGHDSAEIFDVLYLKNLRNEHFKLKDQGACRRYILPIAENIQELQVGQNLIKTDKRVTAMREDNKVIITGFMMTEPNYDFPTVNRRYIGREYKYFYACGLFGYSKYRGCLLKVDVTTGEVLTWREDDHAFPGEAVFVQKPGSTEEDEGLLIAGVTEGRAGRKDFLVILDAKTFKELARAEVDAHVPHLMHALFWNEN